MATLPHNKPEGCGGTLLLCVQLIHRGSHTSTVVLVLSWQKSRSESSDTDGTVFWRRKVTCVLPDSSSVLHHFPDARGTPVWRS